MRYLTLYYFIYPKQKRANNNDCCFAVQEENNRYTLDRQIAMDKPSSSSGAVCKDGESGHGNGLNAECRWGNPGGCNGRNGRYCYW